MNNNEIVEKVHNSIYQQIQKIGIATPVQVLMDLDILSKEDYERWRFGKLDYLERACKVNLSKISFVMREIRSYAAKNNLKGSWTFYKQWGQKNSPRAKQLRFSKSGGEDIKKAYSTHYMNPSQIGEQKNKKNHQKTHSA